MNKKTTLILAGILIIAICAAAAFALMPKGQSTIETEKGGGPAPSIEDVDAIMFTDYSTLVQIVQKLDTYGGTITDANGHMLNITTEYKVELYGDVIFAYTFGYEWVQMIDVHDVRSIHIS